MKVIALFTFKELLYQRLIHVVFFSVIFLIGVSFLIGELSLGQRPRILFHFGFSLLEVSLVGLSLFMGSSLISKEIESQTCLMTMARPIERYHFYLGKWFGIFILNLFIFSILSCFLWVMVGVEYSLAIFLMVGFGVFMEGAVLSSLSLFICLFVRPMVSFFFGIVVFIMGHWLIDLHYFAEKSKNGLYLFFAQVSHYIFPQLYRMNWRSFYLLENNLVSYEEFLMTAIHGFGWVILLLTIGVYHFRRKDLV